MTNRADRQALLELLGVPYELDPASLATLVELALELPEGATEKLIFAALEDHRAPIAIVNLTKFLRAFADHASSAFRARLLTVN